MNQDEKNKVLEYENQKLCDKNEELRKKLEVATNHSPNILVDTLSFTTQEYSDLCEELQKYKNMYKDLTEEMIQLRKTYEEQFLELLTSLEVE